MFFKRVAIILSPAELQMQVRGIKREVVGCKCVRARQVELMKLTRQIDTRIEPHPFRENEFNLSNPFVNEIVNNGVEVAI